MAQDKDYKAEMFLQTLETNEKQKYLLFEMVNKFFKGKLKGKTLAVWGLAFKAGTDDMRESSALTIIPELIEAGAKIQAYDPEAMKTAQWPEYFGHNPAIEYCNSKYEALEGAEALLIITEWKEFRTPSFDGIKEYLKNPIIFDGRLMYNPSKMKKQGFIYHSIGRPIE